MPVPDFFQSDTEGAQREQVRWVGENLALGEAFFAEFLKASPAVFAEWLTGGAKLRRAQHEQLRDFWRTILHLMSFLGSDVSRVRTMLSHPVPAETSVPMPLPKWAGTTLIEYLRQNGARAIQCVDEWVTAIRFGELDYGTNRPWPSTPSSQRTSRLAPRTTGSRRPTSKLPLRHTTEKS
jgi:hypothetical protein